MLNKDKEVNRKLYHKFNVDDNMMYEKPASWQGEPHEMGNKGDSLWRTSVAYITYGDEDLKKGILQCFRKFEMINKKGKYWYQGSRSSDRYREDDVSRDQTIMALTALKFRGDEAELKEIAAHLPFKLSRRFNMTPTMWFWVKYLVTDKKYYSGLFQVCLLIEHLFQITFINKPFRFLAGLHKKRPVEYQVDKTGWRYKLYDTIEYPAYGFHLACWMFHVSYKNKFITWLNRGFLKWEAEKENLILQQLIGKKVNIEHINIYHPLSGWLGSSKYNGDYDLKFLDPEEYKYNTLDKDIMYTLYNNNNNNKEG